MEKRLSQSHIATVVVQESGGGKMNQEQVDAMCPEERRRREEVKRRFRMLPGVDTMPFSPKILSWRGHMECLVRQRREMDEDAFLGVGSLC